MQIYTEITKKQQKNRKRNSYICVHLEKLIIVANSFFTLFRLIHSSHCLLLKSQEGDEENRKPTVKFINLSGLQRKTIVN